MPHTWEELGIDTRGKISGELKTTCPRCSEYRKKKTYPCLNVSLDKGLWNCWHCAWAGSLHKGEDVSSNPRATPLIYRKPVYRQTPLPTRIIAWFAERGITETVLARNRISFGPIYMPQLEQEVPTIQFPYFRNGETINCKYRDSQKHFRMAGGAERALYGLDDIEGDTLIFCEGEIDKLSLEVAGYTSVVSVPDGAPAITAKNYESKFDFLLSAEALLKPLQRIILAVDNDGPGQKLAEELVRRLGPERCFRVTWSSECKDANDVLMSHGVEVLRECIEHAQPWPISGIVTIDMLSSALDYIYEYGMQRGHGTGWENVSRHYTVRTGEFTVVTGIPSHGKSGWVSALAINMAREHGWRFAIFSPENHPMERYAAVLMEQVIGKPFIGPGRISPQEKEQGKDWMQQHVSFLMPEDDSPTIDALLELARVQVYRQGVKGVILDPWNEMEHARPDRMNETEYVSMALSKVRRFARLHGVHVWIVAHPTKQTKTDRGEYAGQYPPPTPYDISGSAHWRNKADNCITIWRNIEADDNQVEVHIQKIRFREIGKPGMVNLVYDPSCGRFHEAMEKEERWSA